MLNLPNLNSKLGDLAGRHRGRPLPIIVVVCLFLWACPISEVWGNPGVKPEMTATLVPNQTSVGGIITLTLKLQLPKGASVASKPEIKGLDGFQVLDLHTTLDGSKKEGEDQRRSTLPVSGECRIRLMVERLSSGDLGPISLNYATGNGKTASVAAVPVPLTVLSNLGDKPEAASLKPIYGIMPTGSTLLKYRFWILGGIALLLLAVACEWWIRKRRLKGAPVMDVTPPDKLAIRSLKALDEERLFEKGRIKDFYFGFSEILRRYLEAIRGFPAAEYTLEEIARAVQKKEDQRLLTLLRRADMVKFADLTATLAVKSNDMESAFAYIRSTREPVMTEAAAERRGGRHMTTGRPQSARKESSS